MKQAQRPLQDNDRNSFDNKLWQVEEIRETIENRMPPEPDLYWIRKDINIAGKTLILNVRLGNNWDGYVYIAFNGKGPNSDYLELWRSGTYCNIFKFEGFKSFSLFIKHSIGLEYHLLMDLIYIDQTEDIDFQIQHGSA